MNITYKETIIVEDLDEILYNHVKGYTSKEGDIINKEWYVDPFQKKVIVKLLVQIIEEVKK